VWFKTQGGLVNVEGTTLYIAYRYKKTGAIWLTAYQSSREEMSVPRLFQKPLKIRGNYLALAAFNDDESTEQSLANCMRKIEEAIRNDELICDLSNVGERSFWQNTDRAVPVSWSA
jgi:hypothetical protein